MPVSRAESVLDWVEDQSVAYVEKTAKNVGMAAGGGPGVVLGSIGGAAVSDGSYEGTAAGAAIGGYAGATIGGKVGEATGGWAAKTTSGLLRNLAGLPRRERRRQANKGPKLRITKWGHDDQL